jgi:hypothetical protein
MTTSPVAPELDNLAPIKRQIDSEIDSLVAALPDPKDLTPEQRRGIIARYSAGVCDIAHSEGLLKALSAEAAINPPDPAADLFEGVNKLRALIQTINGNRHCEHTCGLSGSVALHGGSCSRFPVRGAICPGTVKLSVHP